MLDSTSYLALEVALVIPNNSELVFLPYPDAGYNHGTMLQTQKQMMNSQFLS